MTDRKVVEDWPDDDKSQTEPAGWRQRARRGLHLQQIEDPVEEETYSGVGADLKAERQRRQLSIEDVSGALRIQATHLAALEDGQTDDLPGPAYAIGFLRTYSEFLDLDSDEIIRQFKSEATLTPVDRKLIFPEPLEEARRPGLSLALISLLVAGAVYGGWIFLEKRGMLPIEVVPEPPQRLSPYDAKSDPAASPEPPKSAVVTPSQETAAPQVTAPAAAESPGTDQQAPASASVAEPSSPQQAAAPSSDTTGPSASDQTVEAEATQPADGERAAAADVSGLANANNAAAMSAGDAPAVSIGDMPATESSRNAGANVSTALDDRTQGTQETEEVSRTANADAGSDTESETGQSETGQSETAESTEEDTAPAMPSIQATISPPLPPAAPAAPTRPLAEGAGIDTVGGDAGRAAQLAATESLGYRPQAYGTSNRDVRVVLRARAESWVQVQGANSELLLTRMLRPGDSYHVPNRTDLILMTGNAGAIEITVDGEALGTLGPNGQVRRNIRLSADLLRAQLGSGQ